MIVRFRGCVYECGATLNYDKSIVKIFFGVFLGYYMQLHVEYCIFAKRNVELRCGSNKGILEDLTLLYDIRISDFPYLKSSFFNPYRAIFS